MNTDYLTLIMKVTNKCNLDCPYCYTRSTIHNGEDMSLDTFKNAVAKGSMATKNLTIIFHGGEPTLRSYKWYKEVLDFVNHISEINKTKIRLQMQTNLTLFDEKKFRLFKRHNVGIGFSYDSITNNLTRKNGELIISNFNKMKESPFNTSPSCICLITKDNYKNIIDIIENFKSLDLRYDLHLVFNTITMEDNKADINIDEFIEEFKKAIDYIFDKEDYYIPFSLRVFLNHILKNENTLCETIDCRKHWLGIHPNGDIAPCGNEWLQKNKNYLLGNINTDTLDEVFNCNNYENLSNKIDRKLEICKSCEIFSFCNGGCPAKDFSNVGDVGKHDTNNCKVLREIYKYVNYKLNTGVKNKYILGGLND